MCVQFLLVLYVVANIKLWLFLLLLLLRVCMYVLLGLMLLLLLVHWFICGYAARCILVDVVNNLSLQFLMMFLVLLLTFSARGPSLYVSI